MNKPQQFAFARESAGYAPLRRPDSVRRTTSIDSDWPNGMTAPWEMVGRARDLLTPASGDPVEVATGGFRITASPTREIMAIEITPPHPRAQELVGVRAGGASRRAIADTLGDLQGTPTFQLLDDFAGASLVAGWIWSRWTDDWAVRPMRDAKARVASGRPPTMENICTGFASGASSLLADGTPEHGNQSFTDVGPLENPDDALGWHPMPFQQGVKKRRARRIDVWRQDGVIKVDAGFQDSGSNPAGGRTAIHEYRVHAEVDPDSEILLSLQALPLILPYRECPGASVKATRMIGKRVSDFRDSVVESLPSTLGCTHLNDVLRALSDVPVLARHLR